MAHEVVHIDDIEAIAGPATLTWHPVRATLGLRAFGTNAYTADEPGVDVVEPHTEDLTQAHEELYFVHRGRATFTIDGEEIDAPAGTYVFELGPAGTHRDIVRVSGRQGQTFYMGFTREVPRPRTMAKNQVMAFGERAAGAPAPITVWYPLNERSGHEFVYR
jgi:hypothetical protein